MKRFILFIISLALSCNIFAYAQNEKVNETMMQIVKQYENTEGVESMVLKKGEGLNLIKLMLNKEFGRQFMKGVDAIVIIDYGKAPQEVIDAIHKSLDSFSSLLDEFPLGDETDLSENDYVRCFASINEKEDTLSDFVIAIEDQEDKMLMYMSGEIKYS